MKERYSFLAWNGQLSTARRDVNTWRSVIELRDAGKLDFSLLNILPIDEEVFYSAPLFEGMFEATTSICSSLTSLLAIIALL